MSFLIYKFFYSLSWVTEHFLGSKISKFFFQYLLEELRERNLKKLSSFEDGKLVDIEIVDHYLSISDFKKKFLAKNKPVILRGIAKDWNCCQKWNPEFFKESYGDDLIPIINASPDLKGEEIDYSMKKVKFSDVIAGMKEGNKDLYSRFNNIISNHPELINDINMNWVYKYKGLSQGLTYQCFMGGKDSKTHTHCNFQNNFFIQIFGKKKWYIIDPKYNSYLRPPVARRPYFFTLFDPQNPDYEKFPEMRYVNIIEANLEQGDVLYMPPNWWHYVLNPTMSIGVGVRWASLYAWKSSPILTLLTFFATDPSIFFAAKNKGNFSKVFSAAKSKKKFHIV